MSTRHVFAIGDVHGRSDLLAIMIDAIEDQASRDGFTPRVVFLGDIIDRGPSSMEAMELVRGALIRWPGSRLVLGNHDHFVLRILDETTRDRREMTLRHWISKLGGDATLASYGLDPSNITPEGFASRFPEAHVAILREASHYVELEKHVLVHAGLAPGVPLHAQAAYDLMWIKEPFLSSTGMFDKTVVHGHTVTESRQCEIASHRIGIDTGAYATGRLSAVHIYPDDSIDFLETVPGSASVEKVDPVHI